MTYGFLTDVHGDLSALDWSLGCLQSADQIYFLGDVCGGRDVSACLERLRGAGVVCVPGNHDLWDFERGQLSAEQSRFLTELPLERAIEDWLAVHSDYNQDQYGVSFPYIHSQSDASRAFARFTQRLVFFGHTHLSQIHRLLPDGQIEFQRAPSALELQPGSRYLINVGAAADACCLLRNGKRLEFHFRTRPESDLPVAGKPWWRFW
jgi:predicted phosphodiesterase